MNISHLSINRPVLATVLNIVIVIFGILGYNWLGVREYPNVDNPIISVHTSYIGANPEIIENQITNPIEEQINAVPGVRSISSVSSNGYSAITIEFNMDVNMETAANDVRDKVAIAQRYLPKDCDPPTVSKQDADGMPIMMIAVQSNERDILEVSELADLSVAERLQTINNVSSVKIWGERRYAMRLWLDADKMAGYKITPTDIRSALLAENIELPSGTLRAEKTQLNVRTRGYLTTPEEFKKIIIKNDGLSVIRVEDVARVELASKDLESFVKLNGVKCVILAIIAQPGANQIAIADDVYKRLQELHKDIPGDINIEVINDSTRFIRASIREVEQTIFFSFILVILIIYLFLRNWRVTLIPILVIPVSIIGTFFVLYLMGYSINVLTLLAVVLAIGLVVDDAIVMVENIYLKVESGLSPKEAGIQGSKELFFAVISTSITLVCVFIPIMLITGKTGKLLVEFAVTVTGAIVFSTFAALTFIPMLSTKILKTGAAKSYFYTKTEPFFLGMNKKYAGWLSRFLNHRVWAWVIVLFMGIMTGVIWKNTSSEMAPMEDRSEIIANIRMPEGVSYDYRAAFTDTVAAIMEQLGGDNFKFMQEMGGSSSGTARMILKDISDRKVGQDELANRFNQRLRQESTGQVFLQQRSTFSSGRPGMPVQYVLQATTLDKLREFLPLFLEEAQKSDIVTMVNANLLFNNPELNVYLNRDKARTLGVRTSEMQEALKNAMSGQRYGYFYMNNQQYEIIGEIERYQSKTPNDLYNFYVRNDKGDQIQLSDLVSLQESVSPANLYHFNRFRSATISAGLNPGYTIGDGIQEMDRIADKVLDDTFRTSLSGQSKDYADSSSNMLFMFILAILMIFLVLAAQFESFKDPIIILTTVPLALFGALLAMTIFGQTMNIFSQIALIMLIGLTAKNGILIVEFANQRQALGIDKMEAVREAAIQRLRPILMTSLSTILGLFPLAVATGEGANGRIAMGITIIGGLLLATFITLFVVPSVYLYLSTDRSKGTQKQVVKSIDAKVTTK